MGTHRAMPSVPRQVSPTSTMVPVAGVCSLSTCWACTAFNRRCSKLLWGRCSGICRLFTASLRCCSAWYTVKPACGLVNQWGCHGAQGSHPLGLITSLMQALHRVLHLWRALSQAHVPSLQAAAHNQ